MRKIIGEFMTKVAKVFVNCNLCGKNDTELLYVIKGFRIVKCKNCGLIYVNPRLTKKDLVKIYNEDYFKNKELYRREKEYCGYLDYVKDEKNIKAVFIPILDNIEKIKPRGRILDVGAATGFFLHLAKERGWKVHGIEISKYARDYARKRFKINIQDCKITKFKKNFFDVVVLLDVIEHLPNPRQTLEDVNMVLKKDGLLVLITPDSESYIVKFLLKDKWLEFKRVREHPHFFSARTLIRMLRITGFEVLRIDSVERVLTIEEVIGNLKFYNKPIFNFIFRFVKFLGIEERGISVNPHYKITVYAKK